VKTQSAIDGVIRCREIRILPQEPPFSEALLRGLGVRGLHSGSGANLHSGWLNTDHLHFVDAAGRESQVGRLVLINGDRFYLKYDSLRPLPIESATFEWIFSEHFIEHLELPAAVEWLCDMRRLLKSGGLLRVTTPDLRRYASAYMNDSDGFFEKHRQHLRAMGMKIVPDRPAWMMNQIFRNWGHQWIYDFDEMRTVAVAAGFHPESVRQCAFRQGDVAAVYSLDREDRSDETLYVEIKQR
jgi:predicted SAM-dependent methyltransferase